MVSHRTEWSRMEQLMKLLQELRQRMDDQEIAVRLLQAELEELQVRIAPLLVEHGIAMKQLNRDEALRIYRMLGVLEPGRWDDSTSVKSSLHSDCRGERADGEAA